MVKKFEYSVTVEVQNTQVTAELQFASAKKVLHNKRHKFCDTVILLCFKRATV